VFTPGLMARCGTGQRDSVPCYAVLPVSLAGLIGAWSLVALIKSARQTQWAGGITRRVRKKAQPIVFGSMTARGSVGDTLTARLSFNKQQLYPFPVPPDEWPPTQTDDDPPQPTPYGGAQLNFAEASAQAVVAMADPDQRAYWIQRKRDDRYRWTLRSYIVKTLMAEF